MSSQYGKVISLILVKRFGEEVEQVAMCLFKKGSSSLTEIKNNTNVTLKKLKEALYLLKKYSFLKMECNSKDTKYLLVAENVFRIIRYPTYIAMINKEYGDEAKVLLQQILEKGYANTKQLIKAALSKLNENIEHPRNNSSAIKEILNSLVAAKYLFEFIGSGDVHVKDSVKPTDKLSSDLPQKSSKENKNWTINYDKFHQDMRDKLIVRAFDDKFNKNCGEIIRIFIQQMHANTEPWAAKSNPIPISEVKNRVMYMNTFPELRKNFDNYLSQIEEDTNKFILKVNEESEVSYIILMKDIFINFAWDICQEIVCNKFGMEAARIFHIVKTRSYADINQIQKLTDMPEEVIKRLCYQLVDENVFQIHEIKKDTSSKNNNIYLFHIDLNQLVQNHLENCYKSVFNTMTNINYITSSNKRTVHKIEKFDKFLTNLKNQGASGEQLLTGAHMVTPFERHSYKDVQSSLHKNNSLKLEFDKTLFYFELYLLYQ